MFMFSWKSIRKIVRLYQFLFILRDDVLIINNPKPSPLMSSSKNAHLHLQVIFPCIRLKSMMKIMFSAYTVVIIIIINSVQHIMHQCAVQFTWRSVFNQVCSNAANLWPLGCEIIIHEVTKNKGASNLLENGGFGTW